MGRPLMVASFLLDHPSCSGVATTLILGSITWPILREAGDNRETAAAILSAGGIGAIFSPVVMGAAFARTKREQHPRSCLEVTARVPGPTILDSAFIFLLTELDVEEIHASYRERFPGRIPRRRVRRTGAVRPCVSAQQPDVAAPGRARLPRL
ncbi:MAG TPA: hypothetical protein DEP84_02635 [Chloroflexi bacterium]|nr:hypothetical protein [Chloroflexota bacterium]